MKKLAVTLIRKFISPSMRFAIKGAAAWLKEQLDRASLWRWEIARIPQSEDRSYNIFYIGRKMRRSFLSDKILKRFKDVGDAMQSASKLSNHTVIVSDVPIPGALCVPRYLRNIVPLARTNEEIITEFNDRLRRTILKKRPRYHLRQVLDSAEVERVDREMLRPYAYARHGSSAYIMSPEMVQRMALEYGRLDLVLMENEVVGCMLGHESVRGGKRYWLSDRSGYPEQIFLDQKRLTEIDSITYYMEIEWANERGYDYCDFDICFAHPEDGLLQYKKNRGTTLDTSGLRDRGCYYISMPKLNAAHHLWDIPIFAVEGHKLVLHLGVPEGRSDIEILNRYRRMGFRGLSKVVLHGDLPLGEQLLENLRGLYINQKFPPIVEMMSSSKRY